MRLPCLQYSIWSGSGARIENSGTFDITGDGDIHYNLGGTRTHFENTGTLKKTSGTGSSDISASLDNSGGTVDVSSGTLNLTGGLDNFSSTAGVGSLAGGTYVIRTTSALKFTGADIDVNAATIVLDGLGSAILDQNNSDAIDNLSDNDGSFTIKSDRDLTTAGALRNDGSVTIGTGSVLTTTGDYVQADGDGSTALEYTTSKLAASGARVRVQDGVMKGLGTVEPALEATGGRVQPGLSSGILKVAGSYAPSSNGTLEVEIGGAAPGSGHDQLDVGTTASLGGTLDIVTPSSFTPTPGQSFTILKCGALDCRSGQFDTVQGTIVGSGQEYQVRYNATDVTLQLNTPPEANPDTAETDEDTPLNDIDVLSNDEDADGDSLSVSDVTQPSNGSAEVVDGKVNYTPNPNFNGPDSFSYTLSDGNGGTDTADVSITVNAVNDAPVVEDDSYTTDEDTTLNIDAPGVLENDTDADDGDSLSAVKVAGPAHGTLTLNNDGSFDYKPNENYFGDDEFTYKANDGTDDSNTATVSITVNSVNDAPVAKNQSITTDEDTPKDVTLEASDVENANLTFEIVAAPEHGTLSGTGANRTYTPEGNYHGPDSFTYKANDGTVDSETAEVSITVTPVNDAPVADDQSVTTDEDNAKDLILSASDVDENDNLTYELVEGPQTAPSAARAPNPPTPLIPTTSATIRSPSRPTTAPRTPTRLRSDYGQLRERCSGCQGRPLRSQ